VTIPQIRVEECADNLDPDANEYETDQPDRSIEDSQQQMETGYVVEQPDTVKRESVMVNQSAAKGDYSGDVIVGGVASLAQDQVAACFAEHAGIEARD